MSQQIATGGQTLVRTFPRTNVSIRRLKPTQKQKQQQQQQQETTTTRTTNNNHNNNNNKNKNPTNPQTTTNDHHHHHQQQQQQQQQETTTTRTTNNNHNNNNNNNNKNKNPTNPQTTTNDHHHHHQQQQQQQQQQDCCLRAAAYFTSRCRGPVFSLFSSSSLLLAVPSGILMPSSRLAYAPSPGPGCESSRGAAPNAIAAGSVFVAGGSCNRASKSPTGRPPHAPAAPPSRANGSPCRAMTRQEKKFPDQSRLPCLSFRYIAVRTCTDTTGS